MALKFFIIRLIVTATFGRGAVRAPSRAKNYDGEMEPTLAISVNRRLTGGGTVGAMLSWRGGTWQALPARCNPARNKFPGSRPVTNP
jgi:hypothetical protein